MRHPLIAAAIPAITAIALTAFLVIPTGAVSITDTGSEPDRTDHVELAPTSFGNGQYASVENGELVLDFDGLNDRAKSTFKDVFAITVTDDSVEQVWLTDGPTGVQFYQNSDPDVVIDETTPLEPTAGETTTVGVEIDTHAETPSSETFSVHVEYEDDDDEGNADIELVEMTTVDRTVTAGETLTVRATYENHGDTGGTTVARLTVDGVVVDEKVVYVGVGETETVTFERTMQRAGTFGVGVDDRNPTTITVQPLDEPAPDFDVTEAHLEDDTIAQGESTRVIATVENAGNASGEFLAELAVGGIVVEDRYVELEPNESRTVRFERQFDEPGTYAVAVSGLEAGTVSVDESAGYEVLNRELDPAVAAVVGPPALVGLLFAAGTVRRRRNL
ncbi:MULTISPECIES: CARDB domain-containing protein [Natrialbaceae]|uniref:CARDB domain-containing protein n=1 Tax=Natrialbaceae TaxID=1644061 RepID=UPI00207C2725|nr:CARDB domain-containing protein [Natronococcus sp. CG52]